MPSLSGAASECVCNYPQRDLGQPGPALEDPGHLHGENAKAWALPKAIRCFQILDCHKNLIVLTPPWPKYGHVPCGCEALETELSVCAHMHTLTVGVPMDYSVDSVLSSLSPL